MGQLSPKLRSIEGGLLFWCPGCQEPHQIKYAIWQWDGNVVAPTFSPSVLITSGHYISRHKPGDPCWCTYNRNNPTKPAPFTCQRCHSFVQQGRIQFLSDSTHALAGQTVDIPDLPAHLRDDQ